MPQIYNTRKFARNIERKYGVKSHMAQVRPDSLIPSQEEIKKAVVKKIGEAMENGKYKESPIVISKNKYVIDGHHRWAARKKYAPTKKIRALIVHRKAMDVLGIAAAEGQPREAF
jgi:ParB-like chromosome segregation protein Spo0J